MNRLVIDSSAWIEYLRDTRSDAAQLVELALNQTLILVPDLVRIEVLRGFPTLQLAKRATQLFDGLRQAEILGGEIASAALANHWELRKKGATVRGTIDLLIGTWCLRNTVPLLHHDRDFAVMELHLGLQIWHGIKPPPILA